MAALSWLLIPVVGAVFASVWGSWATRRRKPAPDAAGVAGYERFRAAMERSRTSGAEGESAAPQAAEAAEDKPLEREPAASASH